MLNVFDSTYNAVQCMTLYCQCTAVRKNYDLATTHVHKNSVMRFTVWW